jgi:hypothetical protein
MFMAKEVTARAPRGTKILAHAFFSAADEIPEFRRPEVIKAAMGLIRDQLKEMQEKAKAAKGKIAKAPVSRKAVERPARVVKATATEILPLRRKVGRPRKSPIDRMAAD